ncbi:hypothetical protein B9479_008227 [Cryptococcus floricola]|uniref:intramembrane prenyl-peptidase Rce1 n=1 Tax=Cryptococcus floricola TaxID=2591691 RepID=A0A5D3AI48_9TREE|nr:hypothetical protein B9479_008227 [Cryptococcus floricola]
MDPTLSSTTLLSPITSHALSFLFTSSYVGSLYITHLFAALPSPRTTPTATPPEAANGQIPLPPISADKDALDAQDLETGPKVGSRDHPLTVRARMKAVSCSTLISILGVYATYEHASGSSFSESIIPSLKLLGLPTGLTGSGVGLGLPRILPYVLAPTMMLGPLYAMYLCDDIPIISWRRNSESWSAMLKREFGLLEVRNYVVGPLTEELVFRSTVLAASILGGLSFKSLIFGTPLWFGLAHVHHGLELYRKNGRTSQAALHALFACLFQLTYTTLFGWFASYLFLRTGSVIPPLVAHMFCNVMGIYFPGNAIRREPGKKALIYGAYLAGIVGFFFGVKAL